MTEQGPLTQIAPIPESYRYPLVTIVRTGHQRVKKSSGLCRCSTNMVASHAAARPTSPTCRRVLEAMAIFKREYLDPTANTKSVQTDH